MDKEWEKLLSCLSNYHDSLDAIVVEGYDGVGKGRLLTRLSEYYSVIPYRPDYNLWQKYDHRYSDRWKISGFFWDVYSHFMQGRNRDRLPMIFDRGVMSGAVYNDNNIALDYKKILRDMRVLHILVTCSEEDYMKLSEVRNSSFPLNYRSYEEYTEEYKRLLDLAGVDYIIYENHYDEELSKQLGETCGGCGHYSYGICRHPSINSKVSPDSKRCSFSEDRETQDMEVEDSATEMQCV